MMNRDIYPDRDTIRNFKKLILGEADDVAIMIHAHDSPRIGRIKTIQLTFYNGPTHLLYKGYFIMYQHLDLYDDVIKSNGE